MNGSTYRSHSRMKEAATYDSYFGSRLAAQAAGDDVAAPAVILALIRFTLTLPGLSAPYRTNRSVPSGLLRKIAINRATAVMVFSPPDSVWSQGASSSTRSAKCPSPTRLSADATSSALFSPAAKVAAYLAAHRGAMLAQQVCIGASFLAAAVFIGGLVTLLWRTEAARPLSVMR